jgi:thymidylate kinase
MIWGGTRLRLAERRELASLIALCSHESLQEARQRVLPCVPAELLGTCLRALEPGCPLLARLMTGHRLQRALAANARRRWVADTAVSLFRRLAAPVRSRLLRRPARYHLESGGALIAIVGADGSGKSTVIDGLDEWLRRIFEASRVHLGKPSWSRFTIVVRAVLKCGQLIGLYTVESSPRVTLHQRTLVSPGYPFLAREACRARDRLGVYMRARRRAAGGALVLCDRFPLRQITVMDGPQGRRFLGALVERQAAGVAVPHRDKRLSRLLVSLEERCYQRIAAPDVLVVLKAAPDVALGRRPEEDEAVVRERAAEIWGIDWARSGALVVDASRSKEDVLAAVKRWVWSSL